MENKDRKNDFWDVVQDAVNSGNYQQLNQQVKSTIDDTVDGIRKGMQSVGGEVQKEVKNAGDEFRREMKNAKTEWKQAWQKSGYGAGYQKSQEPAYQPGKRKENRQADSETRPQAAAVYRKNPPGKVSGVVLAITGYSLTGIFVLSAIICGIVLAWWPTLPATILTVLMTGLAVGFLGMGIAGTVVRKRAIRFQEYVKQIGNRTYCTIEELSQKTGRGRAKVLRDLKKMIEKKMFLQGHLDQQETCVIVTNETYQQYLDTQEQAKLRESQQKELDAQRAQLPEECQKILEEGRAYIQYIQKCNDEIPGADMSQKLDRLKIIITRIFEEVGKNPALASDLRKFMNYYLPTTKKLIDVYREMDKETIISENVTKTKREIEDTIDTINQAFENLLNSFFEEKALDVSSDISVLHTMLAQEGLTGRDFEGLTGKGGKS
ncbi:MAG: 5-bromo-4-chloroindolyl phosphate hydrolysis family protein [Bacillota bacterium]|nr:5-bromo-4-chloroindolyl phosphate hydrolysis family protein [Bacillota bacterium]